MVLQSLDLRIDGLVHRIDASLRATFCGLEGGLRAGNRSLEFLLRFALGLRQLLLHLIQFLLKRSGIALVLVINHIASRSAVDAATDRIHAVVERGNPFLLDLGNDCGPARRETFRDLVDEIGAHAEIRDVECRSAHAPDEHSSRGTSGTTQ